LHQRYYVLLEGRKVGPYDRRTVVGMRIKETLTSEHVLIGTDGSQLTVADLIGQQGPASSFNPDRSSSFSVVRARFTAALLDVQGSGAGIPRFRGEVEVRVQGDVLRIAGRFRRGMGWKDGRVKLALKDVVHARINGSRVELWLRAGKPGDAMQRMCMQLFTPEAAGELVEWLPAATPWPEPVPPAAAGADHRMLWLSGLGLTVIVVILVVLILVVLLQRRVY
jgi:hypothetical protein